MGQARASAVANLPAQSPAAAGLAAGAKMPGQAPAAAPVSVVEYGIKRLAGGESALDGLPAVLRRLTVTFGCRAAIAFRLTPTRLAESLAACPRDMATEHMLAELRALSVLHSRTVAGGGSFTARIRSPRLANDRGLSMLVAYSAPGACQQSCGLALVADSPRWVRQARPALRALASVVGREVSRAALASQQLAAERDRLLAAEKAARKAADAAQHELSSRLSRLRELDDLKTQFLAMVSHELRTPLSSIVSFTDLILAEERSLSDDSREFVGIIERNAEQLLRLVADLMLLSGLETGVITLHVGDVPVGELVQESVASGSVAAGERGVTLTGAAQSGPPVRGDRLRLRQVLDNLVSNAVKFTPAGGHVTVRATHDERRWRIDVQDEGIGIPADEVDQLFGRFYRASNAMASGAPGSGIGLSIVQMLIERHGGHVEVSSIVGTGTTFSAYFPVRR